MRVGLVLDPVFCRHSTPHGHPEQPDRIRSIMETVEGWDLSSSLLRFSPVSVDERWICSVHTRGHYEAIQQTAGQPFDQLDPDTYTSSESHEIALLAAGSVIRLLEQLLEGNVETGFAAVRPPGHHAESNRAMGFCLFNSVAIAAEFALQERGLSRVAVVDFDVHHGNGTQEIFYSRSDVLYISQHQYPFYPGTGHFREVGEGEGKGFTVNFPIGAGMGDYFYRALFQDFVLPILEQYAPHLILVSAGYDAHREDPLAGMALTEDGFGELANLLNAAAAEICGGRILYVLEGGYHLHALGRSVLKTIGACLDPQTFQIEEDQVSEYRVYRDQMKAHFSPMWKV